MGLDDKDQKGPVIEGRCVFEGSVAAGDLTLPVESVNGGEDGDALHQYSFVGGSAIDDGLSPFASVEDMDAHREGMMRLLKGIASVPAWVWSLRSKMFRAVRQRGADSKE